MPIRRTLVGGLALCTLLIFLSSSSWAQGDELQRVNDEIAALTKKLDAAKNDGNWAEFVKIQERLTDLYARQKALEKGEEGGGEEDIEAWVAQLKKRLAAVGPEERIEALERLAGELKERGDHARAKAAMKLLEAVRAKLKGDRKGEKDVDEAGRQETIKRLFEELMRARRAGDDKRVEQIERKIQEIKRGAAPGKKGDAWRGDALDHLEKMIGKLKTWVEEADRNGNEEMVGHLEEGIGGLKGLWEGVEAARERGDVERIARELDRAVDEIHRDLRRMEESGDRTMAEYARWAAEGLVKVRELVGRGLGGGRELQPGAEAGIRVLEEVAGRMEEWIGNAREAGRKDRVHDLESGLANIRKYLQAMREGRGPELAERLLPEMEKSIRKMEKQAAEAVEQGDPERAEMIRWLVDGMHRFRGALTDGLHGGRGPAGPPHEQALRVVNEVCEHLRNWIREYRERGDERAVDELTAGLHDMEKFLVSLKEARGPEGMMELRRGVAEGIRDLEESLADARRKGEEEKAEITGWVLERLRETHEVLGQMGRGPGREGMGPRFEERVARTREHIARMREEAAQLEAEGKEKEAQALRERAEASERALEAFLKRDRGWGSEGREEERPEGQQHLRRLMAELRRAQEEGDEDRVEELEQAIRELRGWGEREKAGKEPKKDKADESETERLRKEIDGLRKELKELKKLLKDLLKEQGQD